MTALAVRLDPCVNWFKLLARTRGRVLWIFPAVLLGAYFGAVAADSRPLLGLLELRSERRANAPLLAEANGSNLSYEQVAAAPASFVGRPVVWCVDTPGWTVSSYVSGRPAWSVALNGVEDGYWTSTGHCRNVLAVITGFERGLIQLRLVEKL